MRALQLIYSFFLGLAVSGFVGIGVSTFYPNPGYGSANQQQRWSLTSSIILMVAATLILVVGLVLTERWLALANGLLLGGLFTMFYAVAFSSNQESITRFLVVAAALAVTIGVGWFRFARPQRQAVAGGPAAEFGPSDRAADPGLERRVAELERRLAALRRALGE